MSISEQSVDQAEQAASDYFSTGKPQSHLSIAVRQLRRNRAAVFGLFVVLILIFMAIFAPWIAPYGPLDAILRDALQAPSRTHLLGTDELGRDLLSRLIFGARISLRVGLIAVAIGGGVGITLGATAGFFRGWLDEGIMRLIDILMAFPGMLLALTIITVLGPGFDQRHDRRRYWFYPFLYARRSRGDIDRAQPGLRPGCPSRGVR